MRIRKSELLLCRFHIGNPVDFCQQQLRLRHPDIFPSTIVQQMSGGNNELGGWLTAKGETGDYRHVITVENKYVRLVVFDCCVLEECELGHLVEDGAAVASVTGAFLIYFSVA